MSYCGSNAHELTARLLAALDSQYNVVDMRAVNEIISVLEKIHITEELLKTTRLGKHVNLLRRSARDPSLARRAKVLVKRWRDLVIPSHAPRQPSSSAGTAPPAPAPGSQLSRTSAEQHARPLTSPALSRQVLSPAVPSPKSSSRPGWSGYDSDSQDVILVDDDPPEPLPPLPPAAAAASPSPAPAAAAPSAPLTPSRRPASPAPSDVKRAKRDKKPKKKRGHSRAGSGAEASSPAEPAWAARNGASPLAPAPAAPLPAPAAAPAQTRRNGCRKPQLDAYSTMINKMPAAGTKKVKTTKELLEEIQSRGAAASPATSPTASARRSPPSGQPHSPEVLLVDTPEPPECGVKASPLRNGGESPRSTSRHPSPSPPAASPVPPPPPEEERYYPLCTCSDEAVDPECEANSGSAVTARSVWALHHAYVPGVNGTRAAPAPHPHAVRPPVLPGAPGLFTSVVPLYRYLDYADDYCVKNLSHIDLCPSVPPDVFAPSPPAPPTPPSPPTPRPYPIDTPPVSPSVKAEPESDAEDLEDVPQEPQSPLSRLRLLETDVEPKDVSRSDWSDVSMKSETSVSKILDSEINKPDSLIINSPEERLSAPDAREPSDEVAAEDVDESKFSMDVDDEAREHRTVERAKGIDGRTLYSYCEEARASAALGYSDAYGAPIAPWPTDEQGLEDAFAKSESTTRRDELSRPVRSADFAEWHEPARLTSELTALPYVVID